LFWREYVAEEGEFENGRKPRGPRERAPKNFEKIFEMMFFGRVYSRRREIRKWWA